MCGFAGFIYHSELVENPVAVLTAMGKAIESRGPDSDGVWLDKRKKIGFCHRRLSIVDLSEAGHQPMVSVSGRYVVAFNGEIYNHVNLRNELNAEEKIEWKGHSDTETLLMAIEFWGLKEALQKAIGMFALSLWDKDNEILYLARDRFGEKPLYYVLQDELFLFGSELKSFRANPDFESKIDRNSIALLLRHNYIPAPYSIYENTYKLLPGEFLTYEKNNVKTEKYWDARQYFEALIRGEKSKNIEDLESVLSKSIERQMISDVPLGAFLSGGVDSSLIVSLMQKQSNRPVKTFSIGFYEDEFNEAHFAKKIAEHLGTEHTELYVKAEDALAVVDELADIYDEPFSDSSQIPTYLVSKMAREHVTVVLSGDAGDELFCGYNRYLMASGLWSKISKVPRWLRKVIAVFLRFVPVKIWNKLNILLPSRFKMSNLGDKLHKGANVLASSDISELYLKLVSHFTNPDSVVIRGEEPETAITNSERNPNLDSPILNMMALDTLSYMTDDILVKVDRAAMANSLETRVPFLDHHVFETAWRLPFDLKLKGGVTKYCLRNILYNYVPKELIERPKTGFGVPLSDWLRGPLKEWAEKLIEPSRLESEGFFNAHKITEMWKEHKSGKRNWQYHLWDILMFQLWYEKHHK